VPKREKITERARTFFKKDELSRTISTAVSGPVEIRKEERQRYLGVFPEDVLHAYTQEQLKNRDEIEGQIKHEAAGRLLVNGKVPLSLVMPYIRLAQERNLPFTMVTDHNADSPFALVVRRKD